MQSGPGKGAAIWGIVMASIVFLVGIGLILFTFQEAWKLFMTPMSTATTLKPGELVDVQGVTTSTADTVKRVFVLVVMAAFGSIVATRGIRLYEACLSRPLPVALPEPKQDEPKS